ncbi:hypothetical protein BDY19DRAFT_855218, partial [Irpex rosettiformis]
MPIWLHVGIADKVKNIYNQKCGKCLREKHNIITVDQLHTFIEWGNMVLLNGKTHYPKRFCCEPCDRLKGKIKCDNISQCHKAALELYNALPKHWNPTAPKSNDGLSLSEREIEKNRNKDRRKKTIAFDPSLTIKNDISQCFRIFTTDASKARTAEGRPVIRRVPRRTIRVYTDGSCTRNGDAKAEAGAGIWIAEDHPWNAAIRVQGEAQTNQTGELTAILHALQNIPQELPIVIVTD